MISLLVIPYNYDSFKKLKGNDMATNTKKRTSAKLGIAEIAERYQMDPKVVRQKIRQSGSFEKTDNRYVFTETQAKQVGALLKLNTTKKDEVKNKSTTDKTKTKTRSTKTRKKATQ